MLRASLLALAAAPAAAQSWLGFGPTAGGAGQLQLFELDDSARRTATLGDIAIGAGEHAHVNAFRALPGYAMLLTSTANDASSYFYNVSSATAKVTSRVALPGVLAHNLHVDFRTGAAYTVALNYAAKTAAVVRIANNAATTVLDVSKHFAQGGRLYHAGSTHCSLTQTLFVAIANPSGVDDVLLTVNLATAQATAAPMLFPAPAALWANCGATPAPVPGGLSVWQTGLDRRSSTAVVGNLAPGTDGYIGYAPIDDADIPAGLGLQFSGLLTAAANGTYIAGLYANETASSGYLWVTNPLAGRGSADYSAVVPIDYMLLGAADPNA